MKLELVNEPLKATQTIAICDLQDTMVTIGRKSRIFPVIDTNTYHNVGYYIIGDIYLGADTIVNTKKGAVGEPLEKQAQEAFIKCDEIDFSNTKSDEFSEKDFRKTEIQAYRHFEKLYKSNFKNRFNFSNGRKYKFDNNFEDLEFYIYLFDPEEFILIKDDESIIALSKDDDNVIVCDKKKNSYIKVAKDDGVQIHNKNGEIVNVGGTGGVIINGRNLSDIISSALKPISNMFHGHHERKR